MRRFILATFAALILAVTILGIGTAPAQAEDHCEHYGFHYTYEFPTWYWSPGWHQYKIYHMNWEAEDSITYSKSFYVTSSASFHRGQVFLRPNSLISYNSTYNNSTITQIHPGQDTVLQMTFFGHNDNEAYSYYERSIYTVQISIDNGPWITVDSSNVLPECLIWWAYNPYFWTRNWMLDYVN